MNPYTNARDNQGGASSVCAIEVVISAKPEAIIEALESGEIPICDGKSDRFKCHAAASIRRLPKLGDFRILKSFSKWYD